MEILNKNNHAAGGQADWVCMNSRKQEVGLKYGWVQNDSFKKKNKGTYLEYDYKKI